LGDEKSAKIGEYIDVLDFGTIGSGRGKGEKSTERMSLGLLLCLIKLFHIRPEGWRFGNEKRKENNPAGRIQLSVPSALIP